MTSLNTETGIAETGSTRLHYEIAGQGAPLVLAHAGIADRTMWDGQVAAFAARYRVLRYDMRGYGRSRAAPGPFSHHRDLHGLLTYLEIEAAHLVGCSHGAATLLDFALSWPGRARSLVLVSPAVSGYRFRGEPPPAILELMAALGERDLERAAELAVRIWADGPKRTPDGVDRAVREQVREMGRVALRNQLPDAVAEDPLEPPALGRLSEIDHPTLIVAGGLDDDTVLDIADLLASEVRRAEKVIVPETAHMPNMEKPELFNERVLDFLRAL